MMEGEAEGQEARKDEIGSPWSLQEEPALQCLILAPEKALDLQT